MATTPNNNRAVPRPLPEGVTDPDMMMTERYAHLIMTGQLLPNRNAIHALARDWLRYYVASGPQKDDL